MPRKMSYRRLIDTASCVNVDGIDDLIRILSRLVGTTMLRLILSSRGKEKTAVRCES